jgi:hypothetical protein
MNECDPQHRVTLGKNQAAGVLGEHLAKFPLHFAKAVFFGRRPSNADPSKIQNGTITLLDLGGGPIAVTCAHVISGYRELKQKHNDAIFQIGDLELDPLKQLIDEDPRLDLLTIRLTENQAKQITSSGQIGSCIFRPQAWPPAPLQIGEFIAFGGFPRALRTCSNHSEYVFDSWSSGASEVSSVSEGQFASRFERAEWIRSFGPPQHMTLDELGGLSGGPAFINRGLYWDFVGIVSQYHKKFDAMFFAWAGRLSVDGTIERLPL